MPKPKPGDMPAIAAKDLDAIGVGVAYIEVPKAVDCNSQGLPR